MMDWSAVPLLLLAVASLPVATAVDGPKAPDPSGASKATLPVLTHTIRPDWFNVLDYGAVGDGVTDDWLAINNTITAATRGIGVNRTAGDGHLVKGLGDSCTIYLPGKQSDKRTNGTYRVTKPLAIVRAVGCSVIGDGGNTRVFWDGPTWDGAAASTPSHTIFWSDGMPGAAFRGIHWDCNYKAATAFWHNSFTLFETDLVHEVEAFSNCLDIAVAVDTNHTGEPHIEKATAESHWTNLIFENSKVGISLSYANVYDLTFEGCIWRNNSQFGIKSLWGIFYVRDSNFYMNGLGMNDTRAAKKVGLLPNETQGCDVTAGVYWAVSSVRRSISYGSEAFFCTAAVCSPNMDVPHYHGLNPSTPWCTDGQGFMKLEGNVVEDWTGYAAVRSNGQLHVTDCKFNLNKVKPTANETKYAIMPFDAHKNPTEKPFQNSSTPWPLLLGTNQLHPNVTLTNNTWPINYTVKSPGSCAPANLTSATLFFKSKWVQPGKDFFDVTDLLSLEILEHIGHGQAASCPSAISVGKSRATENISDIVTTAVQETIDAARLASEADPKITSLDGAPVAYFPRGCYALNRKIKITGNNYYIEGAAGLDTVFDYVAEDGLDMNLADNHTDGAWEIAAGVQNISISSMSFGSQRQKFANMSTNGNSSMAKILVRGTAGQPAGTNATRLIFHGMYFGGYGDANRPLNSWSGIRILDMGPDDIIDIPYINGDFEVFSNAGTVLTGFHLTGVTVVSAPLGSPDSSVGLAETATGQSLFVGELMTFKCCDQDFSEYIFGSKGPTYVVGDYYQESGPQNVYATSAPLEFSSRRLNGDTTYRAPTATWTSADAKPSTVVLSTTKGYSFNDTNSEMHNFNGLFATIGGTLSTQNAHNPNGEQTICQILEQTTTGSSKANLVLAGMQGMEQPVHFVASPGAKQTVVASVTTDGYKNLTVSPTQYSADYSDTAMVEAMDALRRLGRIDLAVHYPHVGVTMDDTCR